MEHKHAEKVIIMNKLMVEVAENIDSRQRSMLEMDKKYKESLNMIMKLMGEGDTLHGDVMKLKVMNSSPSHDMEQISKELKENKAIINLQQKKFTEVFIVLQHEMEITSLHIAAVKQQNDYESVLLKLTDDLKEKNETLNAKIIDLETEIQRIRKRELEKEQNEQLNANIIQLLEHDKVN
ncbi:unnamed protein product [Sphenostylis stenocarpa]|uniref:Uncharacterized protein n=1 Tax=Sphenostylis stenocarpa TaxID=92480 RepID=A0AA86S2Q6_9FABA|nr:unnamed protein product [Sphenostylis stenocarpa]